MKRTELKSKTGFKPRAMPLNRGNSTMSRGTGLKPRSKAQDTKERRYKPLRAAYMAQHEICEFKGCGELATDCHHKARKVGENRYRHFMAVCRECHAWIESHTAAARKLGYLIKDDPRRVDGTDD